MEEKKEEVPKMPKGQEKEPGEPKWTNLTVRNLNMAAN